MTTRAVDVCKLLALKHIPATVINCSPVKPPDEAYLASVSKDTWMFTLEEHMLTGGFGAYITRFCLDRGYTVPTHCFGVQDRFIQHGEHELLMKEAGLDADAIAETIRRIVEGESAVDQ